MRERNPEMKQQVNRQMSPKKIELTLPDQSNFTLQQFS
jgi:hypothetical protein